MLPDTTEFVDTLPARARRHGLLTEAGQVLVARAPGRLDVMGGIADYSGSLVLELPLALATHAAIAPRRDRQIRVVSLRGDHTRTCDVDLDDLLDAADDSYAQCRRLFEDADAAWAGYALGPLAVLSEEHRIRPDQGFDLLIASDVPERIGLGSSAALEVACATALTAHCDAADRLTATELALLCQTAENRVVGAACGPMDQVTAACGHRDQLLELLCQPAELEGHIAIPDELTVFGIDSGARHAVAGDPYTDARVGAFMGFRLLVEHDQVGAWVDGDHAAFVHPRWGTYLANVSPSELVELEDLLPEQMVGSAFLMNFGGTSDTVTHVRPERSYPVRHPTVHPICEHHRARTFAALLPRGAEAGIAELLGELMYQSHASCSTCGLGSDATDALVRAVRDAGPAHGLFGARVTGDGGGGGGGGGGGTVAVLARVDALPEVQTIAARHAADAGKGGTVFAGSSPGAAAVGTVVVGVGRGR